MTLGFATLRKWFSRRWGQGPAFRVTLRIINLAILTATAAVCRYVPFYQICRNTTDYFGYIIGGVFVVLCIAVLLLSGLIWLSEEDADRERDKMRLQSERDADIARQAKGDLSNWQKTSALLGQVVEQKADHVLKQLTARRQNADYIVQPYDPAKQIESMLIATIEFFADCVEREAGDRTVDVYGSYLVNEGDHLVGKFSGASRDKTWNVSNISARYKDRFDLNSRPSRSAAVYVAVEAGNNLLLIPDCAIAHGDPAHPFKYFDPGREHTQNRSMLLYAVRDTKDDKTRGVFCISTNVNGFFEQGRAKLCEDFMREIAQRVIHEHRQSDLLILKNGGTIS